MENKGDKLIGKVVSKLLMSPEGDHLFFQTDDISGVSFYVDGDCCSCSYFHEIDGIDNLLGQKVLAFETIDLPKSLQEQLDKAYTPEYKDVIEYYSIKIQTPKGYTSIIFRNESNGYYGGWCSDGTIKEKPTNYLDILKDGDLYKENEPEKQLTNDKELCEQEGKTTQEAAQS